MHLKPVVAVYDAKLNLFKAPYPATTKGEAIRDFGDHARDEKSKLNKHPEDFTLFHVADWDEDSGQYTNLTAPVALASALEFKNAQQ